MANQQSRFRQNLRNSIVYASWFAATCATAAGLIAAGAPTRTVTLLVAASSPIVLIALLLTLPPLQSKLDQEGVRVSVIVVTGIAAIVVSFLLRLA